MDANPETKMEVVEEEDPSNVVAENDVAMDSEALDEPATAKKRARPPSSQKDENFENSKKKRLRKGDDEMEGDEQGDEDEEDEDGDDEMQGDLGDTDDAEEVADDIVPPSSSKRRRRVVEDDRSVSRRSVQKVDPTPKQSAARRNRVRESTPRRRGSALRQHPQADQLRYEPVAGERRYIAPPRHVYESDILPARGGRSTATPTPRVRRTLGRHPVASAGPKGGGGYEQYGSERVGRQLPPRYRRSVVGEEVVEFRDNDDEEDEDEVVAPTARKSSYLTSTTAWFFAILALKVTFYGYWINPILDSVIEGSRYLEALYRENIPQAAVHQVFPVPVQISDQRLTIDHGIGDVSAIGDDFTGIVAIDEDGDAVVEEDEEEEDFDDAEQTEYDSLDDGDDSELEGFLLDPPPTVLNETAIRENSELQDSIKMLQEEIKKLAATNVSLFDSVRLKATELQTALDECNKDTRVIENFHETSEKHGHINKKLDTSAEQLGEQSSNMSTLKSLLSKIVADNNVTSSKQDLEKARELLGSSENLLLDVLSVKLWDPVVPQHECSTSETTDDSPAVPALTREEVIAAIQEFKEEIELDLLDLEEDEGFLDSVHDWIIAYVSEQPLPVVDVDHSIPSLPAGQTVAEPKPGSMSLADISAGIQNLIELEKADQTGMMDYAAVHYGASVIKEATSPSLVEKLPILNRVAAMLSLRFYGFGPEAALTPTYPINSLGQCWAFEKYDRGYGKLATLAIKLARPAIVESVSIEHPPPEVSDKMKASIKGFRVLGFQNTNLDGAPLLLGSFMYDPVDSTKGSRQTFKTEQKIRGVNVPKLRAIVLAIDTNWGLQYTCLYRFRVFGRDA